MEEVVEEEVMEAEEVMGAEEVAAVTVGVDMEAGMPARILIPVVQ